MSLSFTLQQLQALQALLCLPKEQQQEALRVSVAGAQATSEHIQHISARTVRSPSPHIVRTSSRASSTSLASSPSLQDTSDAHSEMSSGSEGSKRIHHSTSPKKLAKFLNAQYFSSPKVWSHLYNGKNRIVSSRLFRLVDNLADKLSESQRTTLSKHRNDIIKDLKKNCCCAKLQDQGEG